MNAPNRMVRVNELLKRELGDLLERNRFDGGIISITKVDTAPNLRNAVVYISIIGECDEELGKKAIRFMIKHRKHLQHKIGKDLALKHTPVLKFILDKTISGGDDVLDLMNDLKIPAVGE